MHGVKVIVSAYLHFVKRYLLKGNPNGALPRSAGVLRLFAPLRLRYDGPPSPLGTQPPCRTAPRPPHSPFFPFVFAGMVRSDFFVLSAFVAVVAILYRERSRLSVRRGVPPCSLFVLSVFAA
uniref:Uncharacterized protein n=1 Tax=Ananas comosus var. bracteatus TaxID=296719 RepID=A0A6V7QCU1_ANACO|nr:unnamed protein product [Ananas comosus var. bracteatus]